ncbi:alpha/beta hydrolase family protein [Microbulbifer sp. TYP-18]|uniref:alpha/beta hydrolase family protein n=1 Tax=Microbulbifer sp. TYP-18 TaxID=3230024 RepID=UPI0034C6DC6C
MLRRWVGPVWLALLSVVVALPAVADSINLPVEAFAKLPAYRAVDLSPDGKRFAAIINVKGQTVVYAQDLGKTGGIYPVTKTDNKKYKVNWIRWANNQYLVMSFWYPSRANGAGITSTRLMAVKYDEPGSMRNLIQIRSKSERDPQYQDDVVDWLPEEPDYILVALDIDAVGSKGLYKVRLSKSGRKAIRKARGGKARTVDWILDGNHQPRVYVDLEKDTYRVFYRRTGEKAYRLGWSYTALSEDRLRPLAFGETDSELIVSGYRDGYRALYKVDLENPTLGKQLLYARKGYDVSGQLLYSNWRKGFVGLVAPKDDSMYHLWDDQFAAFDAAINRALPGTDNYIVDMSNNGQIYLLYTVSSDQPGKYFYGDRKSGTVTPIASSYPALDTIDLPEKRVVRYKARDGLQIEAFLTLPQTVEQEQLPTILFPHGGPIAADTDTFDYWTQFFVSRGYAVLQMNFRGSAGYGYDFMAAGFKSWGLQMQDDISDGLQWLVEQGIADPNRVCIVGGSYGGYAALMGVAKTPDTYRCAVSFAGVTDLQMLLRNQRRFLNNEIVERQIGSLRDDKQRLRETSPRLLAERIKVPVLLAHGNKDRIVPVRHSEAMAKALQKAGTPFELVVYEDGDHYLSKEEHRLALFRKMDSFLAANLSR